MIFITVGNMDPFDRLIESIDRWLAEQPMAEDVLAQIGVGAYVPRHCRHLRFLTPAEYRETFQQARFVVSHAGMGSIITALELQKPIVVMPKRASLGEQRNDHQLATVRRFRKSALIQVADTEHDLPGLLEATSVKTQQAATDSGASDWPPNPQLIRFVRDFITQTA